MKLDTWILLWFWAQISFVLGSNILVVVPFHGRSHMIYMKVFIEELLKRGHTVTCVTSVGIGDYKPDNYTEIFINPPFNLHTVLKHEDMFGAWPTESLFQVAAIYPYVGSLSTSHAISNEKVQELIHSKDLHFDLVINEDIYHDAFLAFGHKFNAPIVTICPYGVTDFFDNDMGLITPISHVAHALLPYSDRMNFFQRCHNAMLTLYDTMLRRFVYVPMQNKIIQEHFGHLENLPSIDELRKNISVIFVNAHRSVTHPRPSMPGLVYIGGAHIKPTKPLPADLQQFLDESKHGAIYFSLGTIVNASKMPKHKLDIFMNTFRKLKQRVIWKFEDESFPNLPDNVLIRKWLPQNEILAHPNVVLFISHGGMFSNSEAVNYGVQMLVIPFIGDQNRNAHRVQSAGYGKYMDFGDITNESLYEVLNEMLTDNKYSNKVKEISAIFRDNMVEPMDEFIWWIDHVIKFRGAKHLKSHATDMSLFTYLNLDIFLIFFSVILAVIFISIYTLKRICSRKINVSNIKKKQ